MKINNITLGCDPEIFLRNSNNELVSSCGKFKGTKNSPFPLTDVGHYMQEDNVALEFNIPPAIDKKSFKRDINKSLFLIEEIANGKELKIAIESSGNFKNEDLEHPKAKEFGCMPDFNAWKKRVNNPPSPSTNLRTCGGHIHIGYDNPKLKLNLSLIKAMDLFVGIPSLFLDNDNLRRSMYGKAGCFRNKNFGVEYRVVSNFWIKQDNLIEWVWDSTLNAINFVNNNELNVLDSSSFKIEDIINNNDKDLGVEVMKHYEINLPILKKQLKHINYG